MTIFFHHAMPAANADRVTELRRRNCLASIAPKACAKHVTGWDDSTRLSLTNWCRMIDFPSARVRLNFLVSGETSDGSGVKFIVEPRKPSTSCWVTRRGRCSKPNGKIYLRKPGGFGCGVMMSHSPSIGGEVESLANSVAPSTGLSRN